MALGDISLLLEKCLVPYSVFSKIVFSVAKAQGSTEVGGRGGGRGANKRLLGMCRWMGSHFHNWVDYNGVTFLVELVEWGRKFSGFPE